MTFTQSVRTCFSKYFTFSGRASRSEYWWFVLFGFLGGIVTGTLDAMLFGSVDVIREASETTRRVSVSNDGPIGSLFSLAILVPSLSAGWRRMHDTGRSGLYLLYPLIVMIGIGTFAGLAGVVPGSENGLTPFQGFAGLVLGLALIVLIISPLLVLWWLTRPSEPGTNEFGPNPFGSGPPSTLSRQDETTGPWRDTRTGSTRIPRTRKK